MKNRAQLGMAMFLISAAVFFLLILLAARYFQALPHLASRSGYSLILLLGAASLATWKGWRWIAVGLGVAFCAILFLTAFSMLTALHAIFVLAGAIALALVPASALRTLAFYFYFLTAVWAVIFVVALS